MLTFKRRGEELTMNNIDFNVLTQTMSAMKVDRNLAIKKWAAKIHWVDGVRNQVGIREFTPFEMDQPKPMGGMNKAPNPVEYLIAAGGGCFAITFQVLASQQGIKLENVDVTIEADLNAAVFLGIEEGDGGIINPVITLTVETSASKIQVMEIANIALQKSPVLASLKTKVNLLIK